MSHYIASSVGDGMSLKKYFVQNSIKTCLWRINHLIFQNSLSFFPVKEFGGWIARMSNINSNCPSHSIINWYYKSIKWCYVLSPSPSYLLTLAITYIQPILHYYIYASLSIKTTTEHSTPSLPKMKENYKDDNEIWIPTYCLEDRWLGNSGQFLLLLLFSHCYKLFKKYCGAKELQKIVDTYHFLKKINICVESYSNKKLLYNCSSFISFLDLNWL